jgi:protein phosphatase
LAILASGATDIGMKRKTNQDSIHLYPEKKLFIVADGMGGHNGGDIASQMSVKVFPDYVDDNYDKMELSELLDKSISYVNRSIYDHGQKDIDLKGMGTTICSIMFGEKEVYIGNVGDSRMYMMQNKKLFQMTRDHSLVQEKLNLGIYDRIGAHKDPQKNVLIRTVGFEPDVLVDVYKYKINKGDIFLICSDGLHGKVSDEDIAYIMNDFIVDPKDVTQEKLDNAIKKLISQANENGGQDNISVILATEI